MKRQEILDALGTVGELTPSPTVPDVIVSGSAWPIWRRTTLTTGCVTSEEWEVWVALPASTELTSAETADGIRDTIAQALLEVASKVVGYASDAWPLDPGGQAMPCVRFDLEV